MANLELNKLFAAPLLAGVVFMGAGFLAELIIQPRKLATPAIAVQGAAAPAAIAAAPVAPALAPVGPLLAAANADNGRVLATRLCAACHTFNEGGRNGVGPNLWNIVNKGHAQVPGFAYSAANRALADKPWDFEALNAFMAAPSTAMPGTRMAFAGMANPAQRADLILFLRGLSPTPAPLP